MEIDWKKTEVTKGKTYHLLKGNPFYQHRFIEVLKYHAPGVAPVKDETGSYHIDLSGEPLYQERYQRTFGFYEGLAAVKDQLGNFFHIRLDGTRLYDENYQWCGNFQNGFAPVRLKHGGYVHIDREGNRLTQATWGYVGDFRDRCAIVQNHEGLHSHITDVGELLHDCWFRDLGVYHKGYALAEDENGWFHIDEAGKELYGRRFAKAEPFYNGQARVEKFDGEILVINEQGIDQCSLRAANDPFQQVSADLVAYWNSFALKAAVELGVFEEEDVPGDQFPTELLDALWEMGYLNKRGRLYKSTAKGDLLNSSHPTCLAQAALIFNDPIHLTPWEKAAESLKQGKSAYLKKEGMDWFSILAKSPTMVKIYHKAMQTYAKKDYAELLKYFPGKDHKKVLDGGGGQGCLLHMLSGQFPALQCVLLDRQEVIENLDSDIEASSFDLFQRWPQSGDAIILSRVLHDWDDERALAILKQAYEALESNGSLYILEFLREKEKPDGSLLNLHMFLATQGKERSLEEYRLLLMESSFLFEKVIPLSPVSNLIIAKK